MFPPGTFKNCILHDPSSICILVGCRLYFIPCQAPCGASSVGLKPGKLQIFRRLPHRSRHFLPLNPTPDLPNLHRGHRGKVFHLFCGWRRAVVQGGQGAGWQGGQPVLTACACGWGPAPACLEERGLSCSAFIGMLLRPRRRSDTEAFGRSLVDQGSLGACCIWAVLTNGSPFCPKCQLLYFSNTARMSPRVLDNSI